MCVSDFACMCVCVGVPDPLKLESPMVVSCHGGAWELNLGSLEEQPVLITAESFLQPSKSVLSRYFTTREKVGTTPENKN